MSAEAMVIEAIEKLVLDLLDDVRANRLSKAAERSRIIAETLAIKAATDAPFEVKR